MAADYLLEIEGIKGESKDSKKPGTIEVMSFSWGCSNSGTMSQGSGGGAGKASFQDLNFMANTSVASPLLMQACANGRHIPSATLFVRKQGTDQLEYYTIKLTDLLVSSFQHSAGGGPDVTESFSLNFAKIEFSYCPQKEDGSLDTAVKASWNLKQNVK